MSVELEIIKVEINWKGKKLLGVLLPSEGENYLIKLENGYNIAIPKKEARLEIKERIKRKIEENLKDEGGEISVIGCGGTISSRVDYETGAVVPSMNFAAFEGENVKAIELFKEFSENFFQEHWKKLAERAYEELKEGKKVIILHGTDTMHYSSAALSFAIRELNNPIIFTGSQRSVDRPSSDARENVLNSIFAAKQGFGEVTVLMHSSIEDDWGFLHRGTRVRKMHTSRRDAFKSINILPLAKVSYSKKEFILIEKEFPLKKAGRLGKLENEFEEEVAILYFYPGMKPSLISKYSEFKGIVLAGTGLGHVSVSGKNSLIKELKELIDSGVQVVMTSQTINGRINMNTYSTGRKLQEIGVIGNFCDYTIESAFVKLSWVLAREKRREKVKELMEKNIAGEITERSRFIENF